MAIFDYKCDNCDFVGEFITGGHVPKDMQPPKKCPKCKKGKMKKLFSAQNQSFDIVGYCYMNEYGKHAWKKGKSTSEIAQVLNGEKDPY